MNEYRNAIEVLEVISKVLISMANPAGVDILEDRTQSTRYLNLELN